MQTKEKRIDMNITKKPDYGKNDYILSIIDISKAYEGHQVIDNFNANILKGSITSISGPSGCGKTTLLNIIGLLEYADQGKVLYFEDEVIKPFTRKASLCLRTRIGYMFQNFALINEETVSYNLNISLAHSQLSKSEKKQKISEVLSQVGLAGYENKKVYTCSGGEQQRIAIAGILLKDSDLILADEPTGSLDPENKLIIIQLLKQLQDNGKTILMVTHDQEMIDIADVHIRL